MMRFRFEKKFWAGIILMCMLIMLFPVVLAAQETEDVLEGVSLGDILNLEKELVTATKRKISVRKAPESYLGSGLAFTFEDLSVEKIRQIEIIRGPGSALYGTSAFVAVINVITKNGDDIDGIESLRAGIPSLIKPAD